MVVDSVRNPLFSGVFSTSDFSISGSHFPYSYINPFEHVHLAFKISSEVQILSFDLQ